MRGAALDLALAFPLAFGLGVGELSDENEEYSDGDPSLDLHAIVNRHQFFTWVQTYL